MKTCVRCGLAKSLDCFSPHWKSRDGHVSACKQCREPDPESRARSAEKERASARARRKHHKAADEHYFIKQNLWRLFRLTLSDYDALLARQGGVCAICGKAPTSRRLDVDHDHECCPGPKSCGHCIRSLLCTGCNNGTGIKDDRVLLLRRASYVEKWRAIRVGRPA